MKYTYEVIQEQNIVLRTDENGEVCSVPINDSNADYQRYLRWLAGEDDEAQSL